MNYALGAIVTITVKRIDGTKLQMIMVWEGNISAAAYRSKSHYLK